jgi:hypothetical protein
LTGITRKKFIVIFFSWKFFPSEKSR